MFGIQNMLLLLKNGTMNMNRGGNAEKWLLLGNNTVQILLSSCGTGSCAPTKNILNFIFDTRWRYLWCFKQFLGCKYLVPDGTNELIGLKCSPWVFLGLVIILDLAKSSSKSYRPSNMAFWPEKSEFFENFEKYFFDFSHKLN